MKFLFCRRVWLCLTITLGIFVVSPVGAEAQIMGVYTSPPVGFSPLPPLNFPRQKFAKFLPRRADDIVCEPQELMPGSILHVKVSPTPHGDFDIYAPDGGNGLVFFMSWDDDYPERGSVRSPIPWKYFLGKSDFYFVISSTKGLLETDNYKDGRDATIQPVFQKSGRYVFDFRPEGINALHSICQVDFYDPRANKRPIPFGY